MKKFLLGTLVLSLSLVTLASCGKDKDVVVKTETGEKITVKKTEDSKEVGKVLCALVNQKTEPVNLEKLGANVEISSSGIVTEKKALPAAPGEAVQYKTTTYDLTAAANVDVRIGFGAYKKETKYTSSYDALADLDLYAKINLNYSSAKIDAVITNGKYVDKDTTYKGFFINLSKLSYNEINLLQLLPKNLVLQYSDIINEKLASEIVEGVKKTNEAQAFTLKDIIGGEVSTEAEFEALAKEEKITIKSAGNGKIEFLVKDTEQSFFGYGAKADTTIVINTKKLLVDSINMDFYDMYKGEYLDTNTGKANVSVDLTYNNDVKIHGIKEATYKSAMDYINIFKTLK